MTFQGSPEVVPIRTHLVPQTIETPVTFTAAPNAYLRYAYARSSDSMASQVEGQDYLCFRHNDQRLVFVVADGVGSSFCGHLAARLLGDNLLDWLWSQDIAYLGGAAALSEAATSYLNKLQKQARHEVEEYELPPQASPLITQALEAQRAYGSEAIFAACRIDHPGPMMHEGLVTLLWMGDTQVHLLDEDGSAVEIGGEWDNANRWSTARGVRGQMSAWMQTLQGISRVVAFTDGLSAHAGQVLAYPDATLDREIYLGARLPTSDDVAFIDVILRTPRYDGYPDPDLPDPNLERPHLGQIWNPTGADTYELRWNWPGQGRVSFIIQEATSPALTDARTINVPQGQTSWRPPAAQPPGHYYYRVRAVKRFGGLTPWSELRQTRVAYPPPPAPTLFPVEPDRAAVLHWAGEGEALEYTLERAGTPDFAGAEVVYEGRGTAWAIPTDRPGTAYYRVRAVSDGGAGPWSETQQVEITLPPPPTPSLAAPAYGHTHGEFDLRWQAVPRATHYELEETLTGSEDEPRLIRVEDTIYHASDQPVGSYLFRVRACHDFGHSDWSNAQPLSITPQPPTDAPELSLEGPDAGQIVHLTWTPVPDAVEYLIEMSELDTFESAREIIESGLALDLPRREPGMLFIRVRGANPGGEGPASNVVNLSIAPPAPGWFEVTPLADAGRITLAWGAVSGRATYRLEMAEGSHAPYREVYSGKDTQAEIERPAGSEPLRFRVRAELPGISSEWVSEEPVLEQAGPEPPRLAQPVIDEQGNVRLTWDAIPGADGYRLEVARDEQFGDRRSIPVERTAAVFQPPASGQYWFRLRARTRQGADELWSEPGPVVWVQVRRPAAPHLWPLDPQPPGTPFEITWTGVPGCVYYEVQEAASEGFAAAQTRKTRVFHPAQTIALAEGRPAGRYYYRVKAVDEHEQASLWSNTLMVEVK